MRQLISLVFGFLVALLCLTASAQPETLRPDQSINTTNSDTANSNIDAGPESDIAGQGQGESDNQCERIDLEIPFDDNFTDTVRQLLADNTYPIPTLVGGILSYSAAETAARMEVLTQLGVNQEPIAEQCDCLPMGLSARDIFSGALTAGISPNLLARHCLARVPPELIPDLLIEALGKLQSAQYATFFQEVNEILTRTGLNGREVLVESLIAGEFLREDDVDVSCVGDCITPLAEALVDQLLTEDPADAPSELDSEDEDDEENFSFS